MYMQQDPIDTTIYNDKKEQTKPLIVSNIQYIVYASICSVRKNDHTLKSWMFYCFLYDNR